MMGWIRQQAETPVLIRLFLFSGKRNETAAEKAVKRKNKLLVCFFGMEYTEKRVVQTKERFTMNLVTLSPVSGSKARLTG